MFYGQWDTTLDDKWRVIIPCPWRTHFRGASVALRKGKKGCLEIHPRSFPVTRDLAPWTVYVPFERRKKTGERRFVIPPFFRDTLTFFYGRSITLAGRIEYLEVWPRPLV